MKITIPSLFRFVSPYANRPAPKTCDTARSQLIKLNSEIFRFFLNSKTTTFPSISLHINVPRLIPRVSIAIRDFIGAIGPHVGHTVTSRSHLAIYIYNNRSCTVLPTKQLGHIHNTQSPFISQSVSKSQLRGVGSRVGATWMAPAR